MSELPEEVQQEIITIVKQRKIVSLDWLSTITQISKDDLILNAPFLDLVTDNERIMTIEYFDDKIKDKSIQKSFQNEFGSETGTFFCPNCRIKINLSEEQYNFVGIKFCENCHENIAELIEGFERGLLKLVKCSSCRKLTSESHTYCILCGAHLKNERGLEKTATKSYSKKSFISQHKTFMIVAIITFVLFTVLYIMVSFLDSVPDFVGIIIGILGVLCFIFLGVYEYLRKK